MLTRALPHYYPTNRKQQENKQKIALLLTASRHANSITAEQPLQKHNPHTSQQ